MSASDIPVRANGQKVDASWFNTIRTEMIAALSGLSAFLGDGSSSSESTFAIANNQSGANITGLVASSAYRVTRVWYWVRRKATDDVMECGELLIIYNGTNFYLGRRSIETAITAGMDFDVNASTGQVTYTSSNMSGSYDTAASKIGYVKTTQGTI